MQSFFNNRLPKNTLPVGESILSKIAFEKEMLIQKISTFNSHLLDDAEKLKLGRLVDKLISILRNQDSIQTTNRIVSFENNMEQKLHELEIFSQKKKRYEPEVIWSCLFDALICVIALAIPVSIYFLIPLLSAGWMLGLSIGFALLGAFVGTLVAWLIDCCIFEKNFPWLSIAGVVFMFGFEVITLSLIPAFGLMLNASIFSSFAVCLSMFAAYSSLLDSVQAEVQANISHLNRIKHEISAFLNEQVESWQAYDVAQERNEDRQIQITMP